MMRTMASQTPHCGLASIVKGMESGVAQGVFPGAVLLVQLEEEVVCHLAVGSIASGADAAPTTVETIYDLASLTKPLATATAMACLVQDGVVQLEDRLDDFLPEIGGSDLGEVRLWHLLHHSAGLPAWRPYYERIDGTRAPRGSERVRDEVKQRILTWIGQELLLFPPGSRSLYSDLGYLVLGMLIERCTGLSLDEFCHTRIFTPIGASPLGFIREPGCMLHQTTGDWGVAPTERSEWRGGLIHGEVHDENAFALGGVAGHAGLFGSAAAVLAVATCWMRAYHSRGAFLDSGLVRRFVSRVKGDGTSSWGLGWDTPTHPSTSGTLFSHDSFGHVGFTGTSIWLDPETDVIAILLSNRVHPSRANTKIHVFRPFIHDVIRKSLGR